MTTHHGHARRQRTSRTYNSWRAMRQRCHDPNRHNYANYGGRGIRICDDWESFALFLADMGERPRGKTLDRIDVNGNYDLANCCWSTDIQQRHNRTDCT